MYEYKIKEVIRIIDGDTIEILIDIGFNIFHKEKVRLNRIDTPEIHSKNEFEKKLGKEAIDYLQAWIEKQNSLSIRTSKDDKYGRILGEIYGDSSKSINDLLIENGYAWEYYGDSKNKDFNLLIEKRK